MDISHASQDFRYMASAFGDHELSVPVSQTNMYLLLFIRVGERMNSDGGSSIQSLPSFLSCMLNLICLGVTQSVTEHVHLEVS